MLASIGGVATILTQLFLAGFRGNLVDWRIAPRLAAAGALFGIFTVYVNAMIYQWSGRLFGGKATQGQLRAVIAWSSLPRVLALVPCASALVWLYYFSGAAAPSAFFPVLQVIIALLVAWATVMMLLMLACAQHFGFWRTIAAFAVFAGISLAIAMLVRTFLVQPFNIPSGSQMPTLLVGDYIFVSKYSYGYTHYSLPFSPRLFAGRIFASEPGRGDMVVYRLPKDDKIDYVSRVVGLPGDRIQMIGNVLHINGQPVARERIDDFVVTQANGTTTQAKRWRETLPNGISYSTLNLIDNGFYSNTPVYEVPVGHYFMMSDNRDDSIDSRVLSQVGYVPLENIVGRILIIFFSAEPNGDRHIRPDRLGTLVR